MQNWLQKSWTRYAALAVVPLVALALWATARGVQSWHEAHPETAAADQAQPADAQPSAPPAELDVKPSPADRQTPYRTAEARVKTGSTVGRTLAGLGLSAQDVARIANDAKPVKDLARVAAGTQVTAMWKAPDDPIPNEIMLKLSDTRKLVITHVTAAPADDETEEVAKAREDGANWVAEMKEEVVVRKAAAFAGVVTSNLWGSATAAGMDPTVITKMAEIFAWAVDFNREVQLDDRWRLTVEQLFVNGQSIGYGDIIAAEYENAGVTHTAVRYKGDEAAPASYFQPDGSSLRRMFLKSPLKFGRITSGFSAGRFHPILKVMRPHNGIDYGAPVGTPIMAVGAGVVTVAGNRGPSGNMLAIKHNSVYETEYKHMSAFAAGIHAGSRVEMGQVVGYVGQTGLATGPHLHFEFHESGRYVDPQGIKFPAADPVPDGQLAQFKETARAALNELPAWSKAVLTAKKGDPKDGTKVNE
jgi:murein DD-endopeptidase MepM/ murein hydrolase activator NlpD